jgi:hypothetical protein
VRTLAQSPFKFTSVRLAFKGNYVVFPLDQRDFFAALHEVGFNIPREPPRDVPPGVIATVFGAVARAEGMVLDMDMERQVVGLEGPNVDRVIAKFAEVENLLNERFGLNLLENVRFYENIASFQLATGANPVETIGRLPGFERVVECFGSVAGKALSPLSIRVRLSESAPGDVEWFEMAVEPLMINPKVRYYVNSIFRSAQRAKVIDFTRELQTRTAQAINSLESLSQSPA